MLTSHHQRVEKLFLVVLDQQVSRLPGMIQTIQTHRNLDNAKGYTISLCTGPTSDGDIQCLDPLVKNEAISGKSKTVSIPQNSVPNGYYYFQIYVTFTNGGTTIHYSPRFKLTGMSGPTAL